MNYQDVRAYYIDMYEKLAQESDNPKMAQHFRDELAAFKKQNKER